MRHSEFWQRLEGELGPAYVRTWADTQTISGLGSVTVVQALAAGVTPKQVWAAVAEALELPAERR